MKNTLLLILFILTLVACDGSKGTTDTSAFTTDLVDSPIPLDTFQVDTAYSIVTWIGTKPTAQHNGILRLDSGKLGLRNGELVQGDLFIAIRSLQIMDLDSNKENYQKLYNHLMSDDFFDVAHFPTAKVSLLNLTPFDSAAYSQEKRSFIVTNPTHLATCEITIRGKGYAMDIPVHLSQNDSTLNLEGKITIDRTKWGISYGDEASVVDKIKDQFIHNRVYVGVSLRAKAK